jgi:hypothetical protein
MVLKEEDKSCFNCLYYYFLKYDKFGECLYHLSPYFCETIEGRKNICSYYVKVDEE